MHETRNVLLLYFPHLNYIVLYFSVEFVPMALSNFRGASDVWRAFLLIATLSYTSHWGHLLYSNGG